MVALKVPFIYFFAFRYLVWYKSGLLLLLYFLLLSPQPSPPPRYFSVLRCTSLLGLFATLCLTALGLAWLGFLATHRLASYFSRLAWLGLAWLGLAGHQGGAGSGGFGPGVVLREREVSVGLRRLRDGGGVPEELLRYHADSRGVRQRAQRHGRPLGTPGMRGDNAA